MFAINIAMPVTNRYAILVIRKTAAVTGAVVLKPHARILSHGGRMLFRMLRMDCRIPRIPDLRRR